MSCGLGLGIFLVWLLQAEHVGGSWAAEAAQNNKRTGFLQQDSRPRTLGFYPQNQVRQVLVSPRSVQSSSFSSGAAGPSGFGGGLPASSYTPAVSQPAQSSVRLVKSSLVSKPDWKTTPSEKVGAPAGPQQSSGLSAALMSQNQKNLNEIIKGGPWSSQQGTPRTSKTPPSSSTSKKPYYGQTGSSSTLFSPVGPAPPGSYVWMQTYARGPARRVSSTRRAEAPKYTSSSFQTGAGRADRSRHLSGTGGSYKPSYTSTGQKPTSRIPVQEAQNLPVSRSSTEGSSAQGFAPAKIHHIPERFGGFAIRRLKGPAEQDPVRVQKPQQTPSPPPQKMSQYKLNTQLPNVHPPSKWSRVQLPHRLSI